MKSLKKMRLKSAREAAFYALYSWQKNKSYLADIFQQIRLEKRLHTIDLQLAQEIAFGVARRFYTLDALIKKNAKEFKTKLKIEAKLIIKMAIYQLIFMDKVPVYAVVCESVELSKRFSPYQAGFINSFLRKFTELLPIPDLKELLTDDEWFSLPSQLLAKFQNSYPANWRQIAEASIARPKMTFLVVDDSAIGQANETVYQGSVRYCTIRKGADSDQLFASSSIYIQNSTPGRLIEYLAEGHHPSTILDVCSSPGGKLLLVNRMFPKANLIANEYAQERMAQLKENITKYQLDVQILHQDGRTIQVHQSVDLIIIDAPCSNTGVLHKKPEAKYRFDQVGLEELNKTQQALLDRAAIICSQEGSIWYMTCSLLPEENEHLVQAWLQRHPQWNITRQQLILPDGQYGDGGYAVELKRI